MGNDDIWRFSFKIKQWSFDKHSHPEVIEGYGGWISIKNPPLTYWERNTFKAIGEYLGGLVSISFNTLNLLNLTEVHIEDKKKLCGFFPFSIEIMYNRNMDKLVILTLLVSYVLHREPFLKEFSNHLDLSRLHQVMVDNGVISTNEQSNNVALM